jgi:hypothetical protein
MAGSLLGLIRAGKPIAHEHDIDIGVLASQGDLAWSALQNATSVFFFFFCFVLFLLQYSNIGKQI